MDRYATKQILKAIILFVLAFSVISLVPSQIITMERYVLNILFLSIIAIGVMAYFRKNFIKIAERTEKYEFILVIISIVIHAAIAYFILNFLPQPTWPFDSTGASPLLMNKFFVWAKPIEVFIQQLLIILLVQKLYEYKMTLKKITALFVFGFGAVHIIQIFKTDIIVGLSFTLIAIILSFIFPNMILKVRNGYIYNYMIHLGIYDFAALSAWTLF